MNDKLAEWINTQLKERGWSQRELARRSSISHTTISQVVSGIREPTWEFCRAIAMGFRVPTDHVLKLAGLLRVQPEYSGQLDPQSAFKLQQFLDRLANLPRNRQDRIMDAALMLLEINDAAQATDILSESSPLNSGDD